VSLRKKPKPLNTNGAQLSNPTNFNKNNLARNSILKFSTPTMFYKEKV
jgi:hypothetical protein